MLLAWLVTIGIMAAISLVLDVVFKVIYSSAATLQQGICICPTVVPLFTTLIQVRFGYSGYTAD